MTKKKTIKLCVLFAISIIVCVAVLLLGKSIRKQTPTEMQPKKENKSLVAYTWEEYQALSLEDQDAYFQKFDSVDSFEIWKQAVQPTESEAPDLTWDKHGKQPNEYTWEEYQSLSHEDQEAFYLWFDSKNAFEMWLENAKSKDTSSSLEWKENEKKPSEYTWEEYLLLDNEEKDAFYLWFDTTDSFEEWMKSVKPNETITPNLDWEMPGKLPDEYTWEEYQSLSYEDQDAFYQWFGSMEDFEAWMKTARPDEKSMPVMNWDKEEKKPNEYTWDEYCALSPQEQDAFFLWFESIKEFEEWMEEVKPSEEESLDMNWDKQGALPNEYTWEEYQALSPLEQEAFYLWFDSKEAFEIWMAAVSQE